MRKGGHHRTTLFTHMLSLYNLHLLNEENALQILSNTIHLKKEPCPFFTILKKKYGIRNLTLYDRTDIFIYLL